MLCCGDDAAWGKWRCIEIGVFFRWLGAATYLDAPFLQQSETQTTFLSQAPLTFRTFYHPPDRNHKQAPRGHVWPNWLGRLTALFWDSGSTHAACFGGGGVV